MGLPNRIEQLVAPVAGAMGYLIVRIQLTGKEQRVLQVMAERQDGSMMKVDDCAALSRAISAVLDVEDPIAGAYSLEVSSPGIDRPLVRRGDYQRFAGFDAKVETERMINGQKRFKGRLLGIDGEMVRMQMTEGEVELPFMEIRRAKLILNSKLMAAAEKYHESK